MTMTPRAYPPELAVGVTSSRIAQVSPAARSLHKAILRGFATIGQAPDRAQLADVTPIGCDVNQLLWELHDHDVVRLDDHGQIRAAYPFSAVPTPHTVSIDGGPTVWSMCAIDALGIADMLDRPVTISSTDPATGDTIRSPWIRRCSEPGFQGQLKGQVSDLVADRPARPARIGPTPHRQTTVPGQRSGGGADTMFAHPTRQQPGQRGQHRPIRPGQTRPADVAPQHRDLVTKNEQLRGLRRVATRKPPQPPKHLNHGQIQHPNHHHVIVPCAGKRQLTARATGSGTAQGSGEAGDGEAMSPYRVGVPVCSGR